MSWLPVILGAAAAVAALVLVVLVVQGVRGVRRARAVLAGYATPTSTSTSASVEAGGSIRVPTHRGADLHVEVEGPDEAALTVVFVHDWTRDLRDWTLQREALAGSAVRGVFVDLRGHGGSTWRSRSLTGCPREALARDVEAVVDATAGDGRVLLVGHGLGGTAVLGFVERFPHRRAQVSGVLLLATGQLSAAVGSEADVRRLVRGLALLRVLPRPVARVLADPHHTSYAVAARSLPALGFHDPGQAAEALAGTPVSAIVALADTVVPTAGQLTLAASFRDCRVHRVADLGHHVPRDAADVVNRELSALIEAAAAPPLPVQRRRPLLGSRRSPRPTV